MTYTSGNENTNFDLFRHSPTLWKVDEIVSSRTDVAIFVNIPAKGSMLLRYLPTVKQCTLHWRRHNLCLSINGAVLRERSWYEFCCNCRAIFLLFRFVVPFPKPSRWWRQFFIIAVRYFRFLFVSFFLKMVFISCFDAWVTKMMLSSRPGTYFSPSMLTHLVTSSREFFPTLEFVHAPVMTWKSLLPQQNPVSCSSLHQRVRVIYAWQWVFTIW